MHMTGGFRRKGAQQEETVGPSESSDRMTRRRLGEEFHAEVGEGVYREEEMGEEEVYEEEDVGDSSSSRSRAKGKGPVDSSWFLKEGVIGGPDDPSMIPSFGGHVVYSIWHGGRDRGTLKCQTRGAVMACLMLWRQAMSPRAKELLKRTGFSGLSDSCHEYLDEDLLTAFIERWQPDTNTFHLPFGEMSIMLHDVQLIMDLPAHGRVVSTISTSMCDALFSRLVEDNGRVMSEYRRKGMREVHHEVLRECLRATGDDFRIVEGWLCAAMGSLLFTDMSGNRFRPREVAEISELPIVGEYAWGAATLAYLYRKLGIASRDGCRGASGCLTLLQSWIYEYFPCFRPSGAVERGRAPPLSSSWHPAKQPRSQQRLNRIRLRLDSLTVKDVLWSPYGDPFTIAKEIPITTYKGLIRYRYIIEPYMPDRCIRQLGYVQSIPFPVLAPQEAHRPATVSGYRVVYPEYMANSDWTQWQTRRVCLSDFTPCGFPGEQVSSYCTWYATYGRPVCMGLDAPPEEVDEPSGDKWMEAFFAEVQPMYSYLRVQDPSFIDYRCMIQQLGRIKLLDRAYCSAGTLSDPPILPPAHPQPPYATAASQQQTTQQQETRRRRPPLQQSRPHRSLAPTPSPPHASRGSCPDVTPRHMYF